MYEQSSRELIEVIRHYFDGIYYGDTKILKKIFHPQSILIGDIKGEPYLKKRDEYLEIVENRQSPHSLGESDRMEILSLEILNNIAYAKLHVPMFEFDYIDFLSFQKVGGKWEIVNKVFTHRSFLMRR